MSEFPGEMAASLLEYFEGRREELLALVRALVETESPSGDVAGSRAVVGLLVEAAQKMDGVASI
ncbi:MAG: hypothetical protein JO360_13660, partial [Acidobacteria bacterium]|nr:hypothetical protein [Acidobacteriota bacterium]